MVGAGRHGGLELGVEPVLGRPLVDRVEQPAELEIGQRAHVAQRPRELRPPVADPGESADETDPDRRQRVEIERRPRRCADDLQRREPPHPDDVVDLVVALVHHAGVVHPALDVAAPVDARGAHVSADGHRHRAARSVDLVGELDARRRRADHQHATVGELVRVPVRLRRHHVDAGRNVGGEAREMGDVARPGRQHDRRRAPAALVGGDDVAVRRRPQLGDRRAGLHRARRRPRRSARGTR